MVSPISLGLDDGHVYNVNADEAAAAVAAAMGAAELAFVADVPGVRLADGRLAERLDEGQVLGLIPDGTVHGGHMAPKVRAALDALARGVRAVRIVDVAGWRRGEGRCWCWGRLGFGQVDGGVGGCGMVGWLADQDVTFGCEVFFAGGLTAPPRHPAAGGIAPRPPKTDRSRTLGWDEGMALLVPGVAYVGLRRRTPACA